MDVGAAVESMRSASSATQLGLATSMVAAAAQSEQTTASLVAQAADAGKSLSQSVPSNDGVRGTKVSFKA
jgi:hypothetical protein